MIIDRVAVENFASYMAANVPLRILGKTISVHGITGAGKTTLLVDAVTCALFGRAYGEKSESSKKWVIPPGKTATKVEVDFSIGNNSYRVRRSIRERGDDAKLYLLEEGLEKEPLATGSRSVEAKIGEIAGLDYTTFLNTIVVRQGEVASLLSASPQKRREVFLGAFAIDFTNYREKAKERLESTNQEIAALQEKEKMLQERAVQEPEVRQKLADNRRRTLEADTKVGEAKKELRDVQSVLQKLRERHLKLRTKITKVTKDKEQLEELQEQLRDAEATVVGLIGDSKGLRTLKTQSKKLLKELDKVTSIRPVLTEIQQTEKAIDERESKISQLTSKVQKIPSLRKSLNKTLRAQKTLPETKKKLEKNKDKFTESQSALFKARGLLEAAENAAAALKKAKEVGETTCPVCKRPLKAEEAAQASQHLNEEKRELNSQIRVMSRRVSALKKRVEKADVTYQDLERDAAKLELLTQNLKEAEESRGELKNIKERNRAELIKLQKKQREVLRKLKRTLTIEEASEDERKLKHDLNRIDRQIEKLKEVPGRLKAAKKQVPQLRRNIAALRPKAEKAKPLEEQERGLAETIQDLEKQEKQHLDKVNRIGSARGELRGQRESLRGDLREIQKAKQDSKEVRASLSKKKILKDAYDCLYAQVFHDRGLPLMLIRRLLTDVESVARDYLRRLLPIFDISIEVDDQGRVNIEVLDGGHPRHLETYSGGEKTLLGFVIRLAIARAMAFRMGALPPKCLIIDEGFGPLSAEFRQDVIKALTELSADYEQIVVISHMEDIREHPAFSTHIRIFKDENQISHVQLPTFLSQN
jgi:DNA repair exonuclease SbcCD ATPase subunit